MPLISVDNVLPGVRLGLWRIEESAGTFVSEYPELGYLERVIESYGSESRRIEILAVHALLHRMGIDGATLCHESSGKPYLTDGTNIGISHTKGCAAVILSPHAKVAVDVEYIDERVGRVAERMLRSDEKAETLLLKLLHWCAKETLYKLYSEDRLSLTEMCLLAVKGNDTEGIITVKNDRRGETLDVSYRVSEGFVITYVAL